MKVNFLPGLAGRTTGRGGESVRSSMAGVGVAEAEAEVEVEFEVEIVLGELAATVISSRPRTYNERLQTSSCCSFLHGVAPFRLVRLLRGSTGMVCREIESGWCSCLEGFG